MMIACLRYIVAEVVVNGLRLHVPHRSLWLADHHLAPCSYTVYNSKRYAAPDRGKELDQVGCSRAGSVRVDTRNVVSPCQRRGGV